MLDDVKCRQKCGVLVADNVDVQDRITPVSVVEQADKRQADGLGESEWCETCWW